AFGFEKEHYDISLKVGERVLLPAVRQAEKETLIIADGFSCREQIAQTTDRQAMHLAQVLQMALHERENDAIREYPEQHFMPTNQQRSLQTQKQLIAPALVITLLATFRSEEH